MNKGQRLCTWDEICPGGGSAGQAHSTSQASSVLAGWIGGAKSTDQWVAFEPVRSNSMSTDWIQIGTRGGGNQLCEFLSDVGYNNYNSWGCQPYTGNLACCSG